MGNLPVEDWLCQKAQEKTREHVLKLAGQWDTLGPHFRSLLPNVEIRKADLFWHLNVLELVEAKEAQCRKCDPDKWDPKSDEKRDWPCETPLTPVVARSGHKPAPEANVGRLHVSWLQCNVYREWAKQYAQRQARTSPRRMSSPQPTTRRVA